jgi:hypothetical protein
MKLPIAVYSLQELHRSLAQTMLGTESPESSVDGNPLRLFIRQPFTESGETQQRLIEQILQIIDTTNDSRCPFNYLTGTSAESADTFRESFERDRHLPFTPKNFRDYRLKLLDQADALINIRVGMSESSAFELSYHIFKGRCSPILFLVWKHAPIKTTLIRDLDDLCEVTYLEFEHAGELRTGVHDFFQMLSIGRMVQNATLRQRIVRGDPAGQSRPVDFDPTC